MLTHRIRYHRNYAMGKYKVQGVCMCVCVCVLACTMFLWTYVRLMMGCDGYYRKLDSCARSKVCTCMCV